MQETQGLQNMQLLDAASQTLPPKGHQFQYSGSATLKFDIGEKIFAAHCVVMKNSAGPFIAVNLMRRNSVFTSLHMISFNFPT